MRRDTKQAIIEATYSVVAECGIENSTVQRIAKAANTASKVIYDHFSSKEELFEEAFAEINREVDAALFSGLSKLPPEQLKDYRALALCFWDEYVNYLRTNPERMMFFDRFNHSGFVSRELWLRQNENFVHFRQFVGGLMHVAFEKLGREGYVILLSVVIESANCIAKYPAESLGPMTEKLKKSIYLILDNFISGFGE